MSIFSGTLDKYAPVKKRKVRGNQVPFMNKALRKAIMRRSNLLSKFVNNRTTENWESYRKQRNKCVKIRNNAWCEYFKKLDAPHLSNSNFWLHLTLNRPGGGGAESAHRLVLASAVLKR